MDVCVVAGWSIWLPAFVSSGPEHISNSSDVIVRICDSSWLMVMVMVEVMVEVMVMVELSFSLDRVLG